MLRESNLTVGYVFIVKQDEPNDTPLQDETQRVTPQDTSFEPQPAFEPEAVSKETTTVTEQTAQQPVNDGQAGDQSVPTTIQTATTEATTSVPVVAPASNPPKKSRKGLAAIIIAVVAAVLLIGGAVAVYFLWYQNPEKVLGDAFNNAVKAKSIEFTAQSQLKSGSGSRSFDATLDLSGRSTGETMAIDGKLHFKAGTSDVTAEGGMIANREDAYIRVGNLEDIFNTMIGATGNESIMNTPFKSFIEKVNGNWVRISGKDLATYDKEYEKTQQCTVALMEKVQKDTSYQNEIQALYKEHKFIVIGESLDAKAVNGVDSLGYVVTLDAPQLRSFIKAMGDTKFGKEYASCDSTVNFSRIAEKLEDAEKDAPESTIEVWVARFSHQLTGINATVKDDDAKVTITSEYSFNKVEAIEMPTGALTLKEVTDAYEAASQEMQDSYLSEYETTYSY